MAMTLPAWLGRAYSFCGITWPLTNEDALLAWSNNFRTIAAKGAALETQINQAVNYIQGNNAGAAVDAFVSSVRANDSNLEALTSFRTGCAIAANVCQVCAQLTLTLKTVFITQLSILAAALSSAARSYDDYYRALLIRQNVRRAIQSAIEISAEQVLTPS